MKKTTFLALVLFLTSNTLALAKSPKSVNDSWYTIQSGSTPWGYYHEIIEKRKNTKGETTYSYRYFMLKREQKIEYRENIGALAKEDLTPITFNINKAGRGAMETINGSFKKGENTDQFAIKVSGARSARMKRFVPKGTIMEVFFPIYLSKQWKDFQPGKKGRVTVFTENAEKGDFRYRKIAYRVKGMNAQKDCMELDVDMIGVSKSQWCLKKTGVVEYLNIIGNRGELLVQVKKVANEKAALKFLGPSPKKGK